MGCGVYKITNTKNNKIYVGSSIDVESRRYKHFWMLKKDQHDNKYLQNSFKKHGIDSFVFEVIEFCDFTELISKENYYINTYSSNNINYGYNLALVNEFRRNTFNDQVKRKISDYNLKMNKNFTIFSLLDIKTNEEKIFNSLIDAARYLLDNGFANGKERNVRMMISNCLRGVLVSNGSGFSIRKTCYKHKFKIIE
jgi:predicted GIY-YIG superfamily endonuclease